MIPAIKDTAPGNWQTTIITIWCDHVNNFVTIVVDADWASKCTWYLRYKQSIGIDRTLKGGNEVKLKIQECVGPECHMLIDYRDKLIKEESEHQQYS